MCQEGNPTKSLSTPSEMTETLRIDVDSPIVAVAERYNWQEGEQAHGTAQKPTLCDGVRRINK